MDTPSSQSEEETEKWHVKWVEKGWFSALGEEGQPQKVPCESLRITYEACGCSEASDSGSWQDPLTCVHRAEAFSMVFLCFLASDLLYFV